MSGLLIGYARVSKADGSRVLNLQRDALISAGLAPNRSIKTRPRESAKTARGYESVSRHYVPVMSWAFGSSTGWDATGAT